MQLFDLTRQRLKPHKKTTGKKQKKKELSRRNQIVKICAKREDLFKICYHFVSMSLFVGESCGTRLYMLSRSSRSIVRPRLSVNFPLATMSESENRMLLAMWKPRARQQSGHSTILRHLPGLMSDRLRQTELTRILDKSKASTNLTESVLENYFNILKRKSKSHPTLSNPSAFKYIQQSVSKVYKKRHAMLSFDIEAYEFNRYMITEIGLSIYDPSIQNHSLIPNIKQIHLIVEEFQNKNNGKYVPNNKLNFLGGPSLTMPAQDCRELVQAIINYYCLELPAKDSIIEGCLLVGHGIHEDLKWMKQMNIQMPERSEIVDTQTIWGLSHGTTGNSLTRILRYMDLPHAYLHNAGNDAYYTLLLALSLCDPQTRIWKRLDDYANKEPLEHEIQQRRGINPVSSNRNGGGSSRRNRKKSTSFEVSEPLEMYSVEEALSYIFDNESRKLLKTPPFEK